MRDSVLQEPWFSQPKDQAHDAIFATIAHLHRSQSAVSRQHEYNFRLYGGMEASRMVSARRGHQVHPQPRLALNIVRACVDTVVAKTVQSKPKPTFLTSGGDWSSQRKAKMLEKLAGGILYHNRIYDTAAETAAHAAAMGTGAIKTFLDWDGKPKCEAVFIEEIKVDEAEGLHRTPRTLYQMRAVDRSLLTEDPRYKRRVAQISGAGMPSDETLVVGRNDTVDQVAVAEAWHLPSNPYAKDGRHVLAVDTCTLVDEPWEHDYHPFTFMRWSPRLLGFYGQAIPEQIGGIQFEVNLLLRKVQEQMRLAGPKVFIERGSSVNKSDLTDQIWGIIEYTGTEPRHVVFSSVDPEMFAHIDRLYRRAFDDVGVSEMAAHSQKPAGLNSGKALLTYSDIESARFIRFGQQYENLVLGVTDKCLDLARQSHMQPDRVTGKPRPFVVKYPTKTHGQRFLEAISWGDIALKDDEYVIQVFPTSLLPSTPAGKLQIVGDMVDRGMLQGDQAVSLLDFPDLEKVTGLITAALDDIDMMIEQMLDKGEALSPEPFSNMKLAIERMSSALLRAKINGYPEDRLELLRMYIAQADAMTKPPPGAAPAGAPSMGAPVAPDGTPQPPPPVGGAPGMAN